MNKHENITGTWVDEVPFETIQPMDPVQVYTIQSTAVRGIVTKKTDHTVSVWLGGKAEITFDKDIISYINVFVIDEEVAGV